MKHPLPAFSIALSLLVAAIPATAQTEWLEQLDESLVVQSANGWFRSDLSGLLDLELYSIDQRPPGLVFADDDIFFNPRLSLFLDARFGDHFYTFAQL